MVTIEQIERADWGLTDQDEATDRRNKAISGYYLNRWYEAIKDWTFQTEIYELTEYQPDHSDQDQHYRDRLSRACPETLPFTKCMVRFESKSPKDSELWGPVTTKAEVIELFYTSLRCRRQPGRYLCIRKWQDNLGLEYRCFWNHGLVAVGSRKP